MKQEVAVTVGKKCYNINRQRENKGRFFSGPAFFHQNHFYQNTKALKVEPARQVMVK